MERFVKFDNVHNFRDLGGYLTRDGLRVRRGVLYRSGVMSGLSASEHNALNALGIVTIFDLRDNSERRRRSTQWHVGTSTAYHFRNHDQSIGDLGHAVKDGTLTLERTDLFIRDAYRRLPFEQVDSYRTLMALLVQGRIPLIFNCTAGKDRTGIAAALILFALGVDRETIEHDYRLTEHAVDQLIEIMQSDPRFADLMKLPRDRYMPMLRADPSYLAIAFDEIVASCGSVEAYLESHLGLIAAERERLRSNLLELPV